MLDNKGRTVGFRARRWAKVDGNFDVNEKYIVEGVPAAAVSVLTEGVINCKSPEMNDYVEIALSAGKTAMADIIEIDEAGTACTGITLFFVD